MLGYANNGDIGGFISRNPDIMNGKYIVRQTAKHNMGIIDPDFAAMWLSRPLKRGGCPALTQHKRAGDIYMDFARFYVEMAEKLYAEKLSFPARIVYRLKP